MSIGRTRVDCLDVRHLGVQKGSDSYREHGGVDDLCFVTEVGTAGNEMESSHIIDDGIFHDVRLSMPQPFVLIVFHVSF